MVEPPISKVCLANWNAFPKVPGEYKISLKPSPSRLVGVFLLSVYLSFLPVDLQPTQPYTCYCYILPQILLEPCNYLCCGGFTWALDASTSLNANSWETCSERKIHPQSSCNICNSLISQVCWKKIGIYTGGPKKSHQLLFQ